MRGIVAGADRVHVEPLHQQQVGTGPVLVEDPAAIGVRLVPVHSVEDQPFAVDQQPVAGDLDGAEAEPQPHGLTGGGDRGVVEPRQLRRPGLHRAGVDTRHLGRRMPGHLDAQLGHPQGHRVGVVGGHDLGTDRAPSGVVIGAQPDVVQGARGAGEQRHVAEDARQPPLVLVLQVAGRRPLVHAHHQQVLAGADGMGHVELLRQPAARPDADLDPVQPDPVARLDPVEAQQHRRRAGEVRGQREAPAVVAGRVVVRHERGFDRERELHIGVDRTPVASATVQHPMGRDGELVPAGVVEAVLGDRVGCSAVRQHRDGATGGAGQQPEPPVPVQRQFRRVAVQPGTGGGPGTGPRPPIEQIVGGYLTAPSVSPPRQKRCRTTIAMTSGITDSRTPPVVSS